MKSLFITGTDTGAGKTRVTAALMEVFKKNGRVVMGMKPVATGCSRSASGLRNPDAEMILSCCCKAVPYERINPYAFEPPVAPLFAAQAANVKIEMETISNAFRTLSDQADTVIVEGIGGWRVPLGTGLQMSDLVRGLRLEVILVVGLRLGCINHALLSVEAIRRDRIKLAGWVANRIDPDYTDVEKTLGLITAHCPAPLLGVIPHQNRFDVLETGSCLDADRLEILAVDE